MKLFTISYTDGQTWYNHEMDQTSVVEHLVSIDAVDSCAAVNKLRESLHGSNVNILKILDKS